MDEGRDVGSLSGDAGSYDDDGRFGWSSRARDDDMLTSGERCETSV